MQKAGAFRMAAELAQLSIQDAPRFDYRGVMVDVARNFHSKDAILATLDQMAAYKMNKLHLHLTDDEGWRLEIPGLPELTEVGSNRCFDLEEKSCLLPQLGSGSTSDNFGSGYFSKADYVEILKYAKARNIEVIPEIDMPAHARAAVISMEARYNRLIEEAPFHLNATVGLLRRSPSPFGLDNLTLMPCSLKCGHCAANW